MSDLKPIGLFTTGGGEVRRINDLIAHAKREEQTNAELCARVRNLAEVGTSHAYEIARLQAVVYVLMQVLVEAGVEPKDLNARIEAALQPLKAQSEDEGAPPLGPAYP
jgi:hypothetical protein